MMKTCIKILKALVFSVATLIAGYAAIAVPFQLIGTVSKSDLHLIFTVELGIYFLLAMLFLIVKEQRERQRRKEARRRSQRREKFIRAQNNYYHWAA